MDGKEVENLDVITAGPASPNPSELLGSEKMKALLADVRDAYDLVLIDTPPVLFVSDASILSVMCDGVILIVKSGDSTRSLLLRAVERLAAVRARILGSILNNVIVSRVGRYYSTYYHVGYSRYAKDYGRTYYATSGEQEDDEPSSDAITDNSKIKVPEKDVATSEADAGAVNKLQQDLNVERVMRSRAEMKAAQQEQELKARIAALERTIEKDGKDPDNPKMDTALKDWLKRKQRDTDRQHKDVGGMTNEESLARVGPNGSPSSSPPHSNGEAHSLNPAGADHPRTSCDPGDKPTPRVNRIDTETALHQAVAHVNLGEYSDARVVLQELVDAKPELIKAWERFIEVLALSNDQTALAECVTRLRKLVPAHRYLHDAACGQLAIVQNDFNAARNHLENADTLSPKNDFVMESLVRVDVRQNRIEDARIRTRTLLMRNSESAYAHYVTAYLHILDGRQVEAERSLTRSLA